MTKLPKLVRKKTIQKGKERIKEIEKRLKKEFKFLFPVAIKIFWREPISVYIEIRFGGKGIFPWSFPSNKDFFKKYKDIAGVLGDDELLQKSSRIQVYGRLLKEVPLYSFSSFNDFENWVNFTYNDKLEVRMHKEGKEALKKLAKERGIKTGDFFRSIITYWLWQEGKEKGN